MARQNGDGMKCTKVAAMLRRRIEQKLFPAGVIPREEDLARMLGVSRYTLNRALTQLAEEGLIRRIKRKGSFVVGAMEAMSLARQVMVFARASGHFFGPQYEALMQALAERSLFPVCSRLTALDDKTRSMALEHARIMLRSPIRGIIMDGANYYTAPLLDEFPSMRAVFINFYDAGGTPPGAAVFADYETGTYMAARHLLQMGHHHLIWLGYRPHTYAGFSTAHRANHPVALFERGFTRAVAETPSSRGECVHHRMWAGDYEPGLRQWVAALPRPVAIVCAMDHYAVRVILQARELGLRVPEDLALVSLYNTPWAEESPVPLTSVSFNEMEIAREAVCCMDEEKPSSRMVLVKPHLVIRESCGALHMAAAGRDSRGSS